MFRQITRSLLSLGGAVLLLTAAAQLADAQVIASETFSYADTTGDGTMDITDVGSGGTGWTGDWFNDGSSGGFSFQINADGEAEGDLFDSTTKNYRQLSAPLGGVTETIYVRVDVVDQDPTDSARRDVAGIALHSSVDESLFLSGNEEVFLGTRDDFARLFSTTAFDTAPGTSGGNDTFLLQIDFDAAAAAQDSLTAWIFDDPNNFNPATAAMMTDSADFTFNGIRIVKNNADHFANIDNLFVGRSLADVGVTLVPEPTTLVLLSFGACAVLGRRMR